MAKEPTLRSKPTKTWTLPRGSPDSQSTISKANTLGYEKLGRDPIWIVEENAAKPKPDSDLVEPIKKVNGFRLLNVSSEGKALEVPVHAAF